MRHNTKENNENYHNQCGKRKRDTSVPTHGMQTRARSRLISPISLNFTDNCICAICMESLPKKLNEVYLLGNCSHRFCRDCIVQWTEMQLTPSSIHENSNQLRCRCPTCRQIYTHYFSHIISERDYIRQDFSLLPRRIESLVNKLRLHIDLFLKFQTENENSDQIWDETHDYDLPFRFVDFVEAIEDLKLQCTTLTDLTFRVYDKLYQQVQNRLREEEENENSEGLFDEIAPFLLRYNTNRVLLLRGNTHTNQLLFLFIE